jgi:hypothetical protein
MRLSNIFKAYGRSWYHITELAAIYDQVGATNRSALLEDLVGSSMRQSYSFFRFCFHKLIKY